MIQRTIGPMQIQDLPDPEVTLADYALVMTYTGTALFDPSAFIASVFERRYDPTIAENGYYWHRIPGSQHDIEEAEGLPAFSTQLTPYPDRITLGGTEFPVGSFATHDWAKMDSTASGHDFEDVNASRRVEPDFIRDVPDYMGKLIPEVTKDTAIAGWDENTRVLTLRISDLNIRVREIERQLGMYGER